MNKKLLLVGAALFIASCSLIPDLGKNEKVYGNVKNRVSVLKSESKVFIDHSLDNVAIDIPKARYNNQWYKSQGHNPLTPENIEAPLQYNLRAIESIGKGYDGVKTKITPIIAKDKLYIIDGKGVVSAFKAKNIHEKVWEYKIKVKADIGNFVNAGILYNEGRLYIATGYNMVISLDAETGELIWQRKINNIARSAPDARDGVLLVNTAENELYALDIKDGAILWNHSGVSENISVYGTASPVAYNNVAFASYSSGELYALNMKNGQDIWFDTIVSSSNINNLAFTDIDSAPVVIGNKTFVVNDQGILAAYDTFKGARLWDLDVGGTKNMWYADKYLYLINKDCQLLAIHTEAGAVRWMKQLPEYATPNNKKGQYTWSGPVMAGGSLLLAGAHGVLLSVSPENGDLLYQTEILKGVYHTPVVAYDTIYLLTNKGKLAAYSYSDKVRSKMLTEDISAENKDSKKVEG